MQCVCLVKLRLNDIVPLRTILLFTVLILKYFYAKQFLRRRHFLIICVVVVGLCVYCHAINRPTLFAINSVSVLRFRRKIYSEKCEHKLQVVDYYWFVQCKSVFACKRTETYVFFLCATTKCYIFS